MYSSCGAEPFSYVVVIADCTGRRVVEEFCGSDQIDTDVIQPHCCPQSCVLNSVERLLEVNEDVVNFGWCWTYFSQSISRVPDQNGVALLYAMLEMHHSGREPSKFLRVKN